MSPQDALAQSVLACKALTARYLAGFNSMNHTCQAEHLPNHIAWMLGHCALTMHRVAQNFDGKVPPDSDFAQMRIRAATDDPTFCFDAESIAYGSQPVDDPSIYPAFERCVQIYDDACDRLAAAVQSATTEQLQQEVPWGKARMPLHLLISRMVFHNGMHAGQIADLRRALHMPRVLT